MLAKHLAYAYAQVRWQRSDECESIMRDCLEGGPNTAMAADSGW